MAHDEKLTFHRMSAAYLSASDPDEQGLAFGAVECDNEACTEDRCREMVVYLRLNGQEITCRFTLAQAESMAGILADIVKRQRDDIAAGRGVKHHVH